MPNEDGLYTEQEFKGLLSDKQAEVKSRQDAQAEAANMKVKIAELNDKIKEMSSKPIEIDNPDETITRADLVKDREAFKKELMKQYQQDKDNMTNKRKNDAIEASFDNAKKTMTEEKMGKGLDFDSVWEGTKRMLKEKPALKGVITNAKNPGKEAYDIGLQDPTIAKRVKLDKKNFPEQKRADKTGAGSTETPAQYFSQARVQKMSQEEIKANLPAIRESQKKWDKGNLTK